MLRSVAIASGILLGTVLNTNISDAQYNLHGTIRNLDRTTGAPLQNARVDVDSSSYVTKTDANGNFSVNIPSGIHNIRFSMPGYLGFLKQNVNVNTDTTFNASMPDTIQQSPDSTEALTLYQFTQLNQNNQNYPNSLTWHSVTESNLIPVYLGSANSQDSSAFRQAIGACDGNWQDSPTGSVENMQKRAVYILSNDPQVSATKKGVKVNFHASLTNTVIGSLEFNSPYIYSAQVNLLVNNVDIIQKELFGRCFLKGDVFDRPSYMNSDPTNVNDLDHMLNMVFFNHWAAMARGEQGVNIYDMENTPTFVTPASSIITKPVNGSTNVPLDQIVAWSNSFGTDNYELQLAKDSEFTNIVADSSLGRINAKLNLNTNTNYFVRVRAKNTVGNSGWSTPVSFTTIPPVPSNPSIVQPINGSKNQPISVVAKWGAVPFAVNYHLQFGTDSTFASTTLDTLTADTLKSINNLQNSKKYFIRVNADNTSGNSAWSNSNFTTIVALPGAPMLVSPTNYSTNQPINLALSWTKGLDADSTEVQFGQDSTFANTLKDTTVSNSSLNVQNLQNSKNYSWRAKSKNFAGVSNWSNGSSFTTIAHVNPLSSFNFGMPSPDTVKYSNINVSTPWSKATGADTLLYIIERKGDDNSDTTITTKDTLWTVPSSTLKPGTSYTITGKVTNGQDTTNATNIATFVTADKLTGVLSNDPNLPKSFELYQNYPNPFNPTTNFKYDLPKNTRVRIDVFDLLGKGVKILVDEVQSGGSYIIKFNASNLSSGVYFYRLKTNDFSQTKKLLLMR